MVAEQRSVELDRVVKPGDRGATGIAKVELASLQNMKYQALVVRTMLKRS